MLEPTVINHDAITALADFDDNTFDAVATDPPYSVSATRNESATGRPHWDLSKVAFDAGFWREICRVLKPGGNLAVFGHSRTWHRLAVAVEDGGFTIIDSVAWVHGQGFPAGNRDVGQELHRLGHDDLAPGYSGVGTMLRPAFEPVVLARNLRSKKALAAAIGEGGAGGFSLDAVRTPTTDDRERPHGRVADHAVWRVERPVGSRSTPHTLGRHPSNVVLQHSPTCTKTQCTTPCPVADVRAQDARGRGEDPARFYSVLHHRKADRAERPNVDGVVGPTVKPLGVMEWVLGLVARPGALILDPFAGTGTTGEAARALGMRSVLIEKESAYIPLIHERLRKH